jgi:hypothetical protein
MTMSAQVVRFSDLLDLVERLPVEDRESLIEVVRKRMAADERRRIAASVRSARREHARGKTKPVTPEELMREIAG